MDNRETEFDSTFEKYENASETDKDTEPSEAVDNFSKFISTIYKPFYFAVLPLAIWFIMKTVTGGLLTDKMAFAVALASMIVIYAIIYYTSKSIKSKRRKLDVHIVSKPKKALFIILSFLIAFAVVVILAIVEVDNMVSNMTFVPNVPDEPVVTKSQQQEEIDRLAGVSETEVIEETTTH